MIIDYHHRFCWYSANVNLSEARFSAPRDKLCPLDIGLCSTNSDVILQADIFQANDLFEKRDPGAVTNSLFALDRAVSTYTEYTGCSSNIMFFLKILWFFWTLLVLLQHVYACWQRESPEYILKFSKKHNI